MIATIKRLASSDFARDGLLVFLASMTVNALGYAFHFAISRKVGVEQYGILAALNAAYMIGLVASTIVGTVVVKYAAEFRAVDDEAHLAALIRGLSVYGSIAVVVVIVLGYLCAPAIGSFLKIGNTLAIVLCIAIIGLSNLSGSIRSVFNGVQDFWQYAIASVIESGFKALFGIGLAYAGYGIVGVFAGWAVASTVALLYSMIMLLVRYKDVPAKELTIDLRRLAMTMAGVSIATLLLTSIAYADVIVVKHYADPTTAGLYGALSLSGKILFFFISFLPAVLLPKASSRMLEGKSAVGVLLMALAVVVGFSGCGLVVYYFFPAFIITALAGSSFAPGAPYVFTYGIAMVFLGALNTVVFFKIGIHRFDFVVPLAICAIGQLVGISIFHSSLSEIIGVLIVGNAIALVASSYRIWAPSAPLAAASRSEAA